ncbi:MAG TPA: Ku protein [Acidimicrobiales bacterium]|nr:Ku protein [Acidimicrobiales bacterium]
MPSAAWSGTISFGLVTIPVKLYSATVDRRVHYHRIDTRTGSRIRMRKVSEADEEPVPSEAIGSAYQATSGELVVLDADELATLSPKRSKTIEIEQFVALADIDPLAYDAAYQVVPDKSVIKPYALLCRALADTDRVAIAQFVMRTVQHLAAIRPVGGFLTLSTMHYADELRDAGEFDELGEVAEADVDGRELKVAEQLIDSMAASFDHDAFRDTYQDEVRELIESKASGAVDVFPSQEQSESGDAEVVDLMAALEASVERAKGGGSGSSRKRSSTRKKASASKKKASEKKAATAKSSDKRERKSS